ncbi:hypothetical protein [Flavobacterium sp. GT3R68]|uniref:hypothetical protein n=1 Tax=Flavobacterium sp. GT3R68 TaxID=2594437 RepID=UPI000F892821|nr:hypothetical protein [Flavobacterium sp. GT3R68]RTY93908.1 hypothetical protein EKL32_13570 [Flavobacterium sp. GSN2]TRW93477.1 hypothetical protein FNW07_00815 [Flavobacterium sp. GT3R68]
MKKYITFLYTLFFTLMFSVVSFAQGDFGDPVDPDPLDQPAAPINDYLWVLILVGLVFVFYKYRTYSKQQKA